MLDKKINLSNFFNSSSEWVIKLQRQHAASTHLAQVLLMNLCAVGVQEVCKGDKSLEDEEHSGQPLEADKTIERIIRADPLTATREEADELSISHSTVVGHLKQIGEVEKLSKWVSHELTTNQKHRLLLLHTKTANHFSTGL